MILVPRTQSGSNYTTDGKKQVVKPLSALGVIGYGRNVADLAFIPLGPCSVAVKLV